MLGWLSFSIDEAAAIINGGSLIWKSVEKIMEPRVEPNVVRSRALGVKPRV